MKQNGLRILQIIAAAIIVFLSTAMITEKESEAGEIDKVRRITGKYVTVYRQLPDSICEDTAEMIAPGNYRENAGDGNIPAGTNITDTAGNTPVLSVDFEALGQINSDITAWIYAGNINLNYPVVQTDDNEYYLTHSFLKEKSRPGTIFLDCENDIYRSDVLILYGHNMGKGRAEMFGALECYDNPGSASAGKEDEIIISTPDGIERRWKIFAVCHIDVNTQAATLYKKTNFSGKEEFDSYICMVKNNQLYESGLTPGYGDRILILSTCAGDISNNKNIRRVVIAYEKGNEQH